MEHPDRPLSAAHASPGVNYGDALLQQISVVFWGPPTDAVIYPPSPGIRTEEVERAVLEALLDTFRELRRQMLQL